MGVHDSITFKAPVKDIAAVYESSSIFVLTSRHEGFSMVLLESQSYGIPAVSLACKCGPRDIIEDGVNGFLVEVENLDLFAERLETLMRDEALRKAMGAKAREKSERFSEDGVMAKWDELFNGLK